MYTGWLIYSKEDAKKNQSYINWFIEEAEKAGIELQLILRESLKIGIVEQKRRLFVQDKPAQLPQFAVVRTIEPILNAQLESLGIHVFNNSKVATICNNKAWTHHAIEQLKIRMTDTYFYTKELLTEVPPLVYPFVLKEATGRSGKQVYFIQNDREWEYARHQLQTKTVIVQSANVQLGKDLRVFVIGKEIIGAVLRENSTDFRANFKLGGTASIYKLNPSEEKMINSIINHFDFGLVGIDFLIGKNGELLFNEIEDVVGSRTLSAVSDINTLEKYVAHIKKRLI